MIRITRSVQTQSHNSSNGLPPGQHAGARVPETEAKEAPSSSAPHPTAHIRLRDFFRLEPWVLVKNGNIGGYFDFVPEHLRVGPWSITAIVYLTVIVVSAALAAFLIWHHNHLDDYLPILYTADYGQAWDGRFLYNSLAFCWMVGIMIWLASGPRGVLVWSTYTVQSWTMLAFRHGLCAAASMLQWPSLIALAELTRFPMVCSTTVTFLVWNTAVMPFIYWHLKEPKRRQAFLKFCFSFRLVNIHIFNIVFCYVNAIWASPPRELVLLDFYWAFLSVVFYLSWYLLVMDRLGIHLYPVFSPRANGFMVVTMWSLLLAIYVATFWVWRKAMLSQNLSAVVQR